MFKLYFLILVSSSLLFSNNNPQKITVDIYKNISFFTKDYSLEKETNQISVFLPENTKLEDIEINSLCNQKKIKLTKKIYLPKDIKELKNKIESLKTEIESLTYQNRLLKTISFKEKTVKEIDALLQSFDSKYRLNKQKIYNLQKELKEEEKKLEDLKNKIKLNFKQLSLSLTCKEKNSKLTIKYPQNDFYAESFYNISADTINSKVSIVQKIKIKQKTGEKLENIKIVSHSSFYNKRVSPPPFYPKYMTIQKKRFSSAKMLRAAPANYPILKDNFKRYATTFSFIIDKASLPNNEEKIFTILKRNYDVKFLNEIDGYGDNLAYLKTTFKSDIFYQRAEAYLFLDGYKIGKTVMKETKENQKRDLYFGENQNINIKKSILKNFNESEFFGNKTKTTKAWNYYIQNNSPRKTMVSLVERLPVSRDENIEITPIFDTVNAKIGKTGKTVFEFMLKKSKNIKFGYTITKPKE